VITLGVIADTHIPDRARALNPQILPIFTEAGVQAILHAGDACLPGVFAQLEAVAPVHAVRGNRDWFGFRHTPLSQVLTFEGVKIGLTHGHAGMRKYVYDKLSFLLMGPHSLRYFMHRAMQVLPEDIDVLVFGHNHVPMNFHLDGKLVFNPGSACCPGEVIRDQPPSVGLLHIDGDKVEGEIVQLCKEE
jgi:putative phosphoesterase